jgi:aquaporin Z
MLNCIELGISFVAFAPFIGIVRGVYLFGRISIPHFNPAVTRGFLITKHISKRQLVLYITAEITGALLGSLFVKYVVGVQAYLGANSPNYVYPLPLIFGVECPSSALLMAVILIVVYSKGLRFRWWNSNRWNCRIGYILFSIHIRSFYESCTSLAPALLSGVFGNLWL